MVQRSYDSFVCNNCTFPHLPSSRTIGRYKERLLGRKYKFGPNKVHKSDDIDHVQGSDNKSEENEVYRITPLLIINLIPL